NGDRSSRYASCSRKLASSSASCWAHGSRSASLIAVLDRLLRLCREQEADGLLLLLGEMCVQTRRACEDRHGLHSSRRVAEVEHHGGDGKGDIERERLAPRLGDGFPQGSRERDVRAA